MRDGNLHALKEYQSFKSFPEREFEPLVDLGIYISKMPIAFLYLFEKETPTIKACKGIIDEEINILLLLCKNVIDPYKICEVSASEASQILSSSRITSEYFASFPLLDPNGFSLGAFCVMDTASNTLDSEQKNALSILSRQVVEKIASQNREMESAYIQATIFHNALLESERYFVMTADKNGIIKSFNKGAEKLFGYASGEIVDKASLNLFIGEEGIKARAEALSKEFNCIVEADGFSVAVERPKRGLVDENEWVGIKKTGEKVTVSVVGIALRDFEDEVVGFLGMGTDITEKKRTEEELVHSRNYYRKLINSIPHPVFVKDRQHRCVLLNDACVAMMQTSREEVEGKHSDDIFPSEFTKIIYEKDETCFNEPKKMSREEADFEFKVGDEKVVNFAAIYYRTVFTNDFNDEFLAISIIDITERKEAESKLAKSEQSFRALVEDSTDFITILESDGTFRYESPSFYRATGFTEDQVIGQSSSQFIHPEDKARTITKFLEAVENADGKYRDVFRHKKANGEWMILEAVGRNRLNDGAVEGMVVNSRDITERKAAEVELQRSEQRLRALIENSSDHIVILEADGRIRYGSPSLFRASGFDEEDLIGRYCSEFIHEEDNARVIETFKTAVGEPAAVYTDQFRYRRSNGEWMTLEVIGKNALADESVKGIVLNLRDVTERKKAEAELIKSEQRFKAFVQNSSDIITILEADGTFRYQSPSFYKFIGYKEEDVIGRNTLEYIHPDYIKRSREIFLEALETPGSTYRDEFLFKKANGEWMMMEVSGKNALDDEAIKAVVVNCRDVTERKKIEAEIRIKSKMLQGITSNMPVVIFRVDKEGYFTESIGAGLKKIGFQENEVVGQRIEELFPEMIEEIRKVQSGEPATAILESKDESNRWFYEFYAFPDRDNEDGQWIGFGLDISDKKNHEETQRQYAARLEKVNKELDQFAYVVSHDLKAPLRAINNLSEWIEDDLGDALSENEDVKNNMMLLRKRVGRMEALINGILEYSRAGRSEIVYEKVDMNELLEDVCGSIEIPETFILEKSPLPVIAGNKVRLEQIFSNLLSNAVKYHDKPSGKLKITYDTKDDFHEFTVADDGPGIDPQHHDKIFVIFQTLVSKDKTESTGVGLAIVKKIIEEQGGKIWVTSTSGTGSKFSFTLPIKKVTNANQV